MTNKATSRPSLAGRDLVSMRDIGREELLAILDEAVQFEGYERPILRGKVLGSLFFEPSTRT
ncbi:MAG TPA: hypothetical protein VFD43_11120, partial [Planctomycetota bacterium]|nr:hypothetical protein [Planctomycetota bacterium]